MATCKEKTPIAVSVLNSVAALAADITFSGGKLNVTNLGETVDLSDATSYEFTPYSAGVASVKEYDFAAVSLIANTQYRFAVIVDCHIAFNGGGQEANQLIPIREYVVSVDATPTTVELRDSFVARINQDPGSLVTAVAGVGSVMELTINSVDEGDFRYEAPTATVETVTTAFVDPSGTPDIVALLAPGQESASAEYDTYRISFDKERRHNAVGGGFVGFPEDVKIFLDSLDGDAAAFVTAMDAILDGSHTPVADYLGV